MEADSKVTELQNQINQLKDDNAKLEEALKISRSGLNSPVISPGIPLITAESRGATMQALEQKDLDDQGAIAALQERITALEAKDRQLQEQVKSVEESKRLAKNDVKEWMADFEEREGRPPNNQDKASVRDLFVTYKSAETKAKEAADALAANTTDLEGAKQELASLQRRATIQPSQPKTSIMLLSAPVTPPPTELVSTARAAGMQAKVRDLEGKIATAKAGVDDLEGQRKAKKAQIKDWMSEFEQREGRPPTNQDKEAVRDMFVEYKTLEAKYKQSSDALQASQMELEAAKKALNEVMSQPQQLRVTGDSGAVQIEALKSKIATLEASMASARGPYEELETQRKDKKAQIKQWMADFEQKEGRPPTNHDKEVVKDMFVEYKKLEAKSKQDADKLSALQQEIDAAQAELVALKSMPLSATVMSMTSSPLSPVPQQSSLQVSDDT